jgi:hypothetical protein
MLHVFIDLPLLSFFRLWRSEEYLPKELWPQDNKGRKPMYDEEEALGSYETVRIYEANANDKMLCQQCFQSDAARVLTENEGIALSVSHGKLSFQFIHRSADRIGVDVEISAKANTASCQRKVYIQPTVHFFLPSILTTAIITFRRIKMIMIPCMTSIRLSFS